MAAIFIAVTAGFLLSLVVLARPYNLTVVSYFAYGSVVQSVDKQIGGYILGCDALKRVVSSSISVSCEYHYNVNVSYCPDMEASIADWAAKRYYQSLEKEEALIFINPGTPKVT